MTTLAERLTHAKDNSALLSDWERGFVESLDEQWKKRNSLSPRQVEILERIETQKLSAEAQDTKKAWDDAYGDEKRRIARICAEYYLHSGYFTNLADSIINDVGYVPTEKAWKKMCQNKYALKVVANHDAEPKYPVGTLVQFRASSRSSGLEMPCVVISAGGPIKSAAKGSKPYKVLPFGHACPIACEERQIKKCKNPTKLTKTKKIVDNSILF